MSRRGWVRGSRGRVFWLLGGFVLCQAALALAVDAWLGDVRDPECQAKIRRLKERLAESSSQPLVLILGSSRTAYGLDARSLSTGGAGPPALVFNFGLMGGGPVLERVALSRLLAEGIRPDLLFLEIVPNMLVDREDRLMEERVLDAARFCAGEVGLARGYYHQPHRLFACWGLGRALPSYRHQTELGACVLRAPRPELRRVDPTGIDTHGWHPRLDRPMPKYRRRTSALARMQNDDFASCTTLAAGPVRALEDVLGMCRKEGIPVTLLRMPEGTEFRALYTPGARATLAGLLDRLRAEWGVGLIDAQDWVADDGFWDTHHLLAGGARRFTRRFGREAVRPALTGLRCAARGPSW